VLFKADRSFERIVLEQPVEGTTIRIFKRGDEADAELARRRARATLEYWCKHARVEIRLDDELISRPMDLAGHCVISHEEDQAKLQLAYVEERAALRGYYHAGLTLHEEHDDRLPHVAFKIDSRYLEHTLTRDNVIRDDNFAKAMAIVANLARTRLLEALLDACERAAIERRFDAQAEFLRARLLDATRAEGKPQVDLFERPVVPTVGGDPVSLTEIRRQIRRCWQAPAASPVTALLRARGDLVLELPPASVLALIIRAHAGRSPSEVGSVCVPGPATPSELGPWEQLRTATHTILRGLELEVGDIALGHLAYPGSAVADHVAITQASFGELTRIEEIGELSSGWFRRGRVVVVNADHPTVVDLLALAEREPELAAYLLLKLFFLRGKLDPKLDGRLASLAAEARWRRSIG
jgi:molecular chaperone HtpG